MVVGNIVQQLAQSIGVGEPALRLILSIFLGKFIAYAVGVNGRII